MQRVAHTIGLRDLVLRLYIAANHAPATIHGDLFPVAVARKVRLCFDAVHIAMIAGMPRARQPTPMEDQVGCLQVSMRVVFSIWYVLPKKSRVRGVCAGLL